MRVYVTTSRDIVLTIMRLFATPFYVSRIDMGLIALLGRLVKLATAVNVYVDWRLADVKTVIQSFAERVAKRSQSNVWVYQAMSVSTTVAENSDLIIGFDHDQPRTLVTAFRIPICESRERTLVDRCIRPSNMYKVPKLVLEGRLSASVTEYMDIDKALGRVVYAGHVDMLPRDRIERIRKKRVEASDADVVVLTYTSIGWRKKYVGLAVRPSIVWRP